MAGLLGGGGNNNGGGGGLLGGYVITYLIMWVNLLISKTQAPQHCRRYYQRSTNRRRYHIPLTQDSWRSYRWPSYRRWRWTKTTSSSAILAKNSTSTITISRTNESLKRGGEEGQSVGEEEETNGYQETAAGA